MDETRQSEKLYRQLQRLSSEMEKFNIADYLALLNNPRRYLFLNFIGGLSRGFGIAIGMTLLGAIALYILQRVVVWNLPLIGDFIADLVNIVQGELKP